MTDVAPPIAEGLTARGLWCVAYRAADGAVDVLAFRCRKLRGGAVDLGECVVAARLRGETWLSTVGLIDGATRRDVTSWARAHVDDADA